MTRVAIAGAAGETAPVGDGRDNAELLEPVVARALAAAGVGRDEVGLLLTASSEFVDGTVGTVMGAFDAFPGWPPRAHAHLEGDGAFALEEAWIRLLAGEARVALVCAWSRPLADDPTRVLDLQLDPYLVAPLAPRSRDLAGLQFDGDPVASTVRAGAAAVVLAVDGRGPAVVGIEQRAEAQYPGARDVTTSASTAAAAAALGLPGTSIGVLEVHAPFRHQEAIVVDAIGAASIGSLTPSGGAAAADPIMVTGLLRVVEAAEAVRRGDARQAVAHATNGPCLQHNLLCAIEAP